MPLKPSRSSSASVRLWRSGSVIRRTLCHKCIHVSDASGVEEPHEVLEAPPSDQPTMPPQGQPRAGNGLQERVEAGTLVPALGARNASILELLDDGPAMPL